MPEDPTNKPSHAQQTFAQKAFEAKAQAQSGPQSERVIRRPAVQEMTGVSCSSIYSWMDPKSRHYDPTFPKPIKLGARAVGWREKEVIAWLDTREQVAA